MVLLGSLKLTGAGMALGTLGAVILSRALAGVIQDLASGDPVLYAASIAVLGGSRSFPRTFPRGARRGWIP